LNRKGYSLIEAVSSSAILSVASACLCMMSLHCAESISSSFFGSANICRAQAVMERAKATGYTDLDSIGELKVSEIGPDMKELDINVEGYAIYAIRSRFD